MGFFNEYNRWRETHPLKPLLPLGYTLCRKLIPTGVKWMWMLARLIVFSLLLIPAWISIVWFYFTSENIKRNTRYGNKARNFLDIYYPNEVLAGRTFPVLIFFSGGAWIIGYKAWGALFSKILVQMGIICVTPDYRNFPQGRIDDMLEDCDQAIDWVFKNIKNYGGDPNRIFIGGQSAGAHITLMTLLKKSDDQQKPEFSSNNKWDTSKVNGYFGISGPYDILVFKDHFHQRGLHKNLYNEIFNRSIDSHRFCPSAYLKGFSPSKPFTGHLPSLYFFHGTADKSCPHTSTLNIAQALTESGCKAAITTKYYEGKSHTDLILEDLMHDDSIHEGDLVHDISQILHNRPLVGHVVLVNPGEEGNFISPDAPRRRRVPSFLSTSSDPFNIRPAHAVQTIINSKLLSLARLVNPF